MNLSRAIALAGALALTTGLPPAAVAHGQSRDVDGTYMETLQIARGSRLGVTVEDVADSDRKDVKSGIVVETVEPGGPADKAGIKAGDAIVEFDADRVRSVRQFQRLVQEAAPDRAVPVVLARGGQRVTVNVTPEAWRGGDDFGFRLLDVPRAVRPAIPPTPPPAPRAPTPPAMEWFGDGALTVIAGRGRLGITTEQLNGQLAEYFGVKEGALVKSVQDGSAAAKAGVKAGDVITGINGSRVYDPSDVSRAVNRLEDGAEFTMDVVRDRKTQTIKGKVEQRRVRRGGVS